eukprot:m.125111 g.125111  ORF g.125111 m.125111 type:complete len:730 (-) comp15611_c0_seq1:296-2485(-)
MSADEELYLWHRSCLAFKDHKYEEALQLLQASSEQTAKTLYNQAMINICRKDLDAAMKNLNEVLERDPLLAVANFQRGVLSYLVGFYPEAVIDFEYALANLFEKPFVDYRQLGLPIKLYACEIHFNIAKAAKHAGENGRAERALESAANASLHFTQPHKELSGNTSRSLFELNLAVFAPPASKVAGLQKRDFMGKSELKVSLWKNDKEVGFNGEKLLKQFEEKLEAKAPERKKEAPPNRPTMTAEALKRLAVSQGLVDHSLALGTHRALYDYVPTADDELALQVGDVITLRETVGDAWCKGMNHRTRCTGLIPLNYLKEEKSNTSKDPVRPPPPSRTVMSTSSSSSSLSSTVGAAPTRSPPPSRRPPPPPSLLKTPTSSTPLPQALSTTPSAPAVQSTIRPGTSKPLLPPPGSPAPTRRPPLPSQKPPPPHAKPSSPSSSLTSDLANVLQTRRETLASQSVGTTANISTASPATQRRPPPPSHKPTLPPPPPTKSSAMKPPASRDKPSLPPPVSTLSKQHQVPPSKTINGPSSSSTIGPSQLRETLGLSSPTPSMTTDGAKNHDRPREESKPLAGNHLMTNSGSGAQTLSVKARLRAFQQPSTTTSSLSDSQQPEQRKSPALSKPAAPPNKPVIPKPIPVIVSNGIAASDRKLKVVISFEGDEYSARIKAGEPLPVFEKKVMETIECEDPSAGIWYRLAPSQPLLRLSDDSHLRFLESQSPTIQVVVKK